MVGVEGVEMTLWPHTRSSLAFHRPVTFQAAGDTSDASRLLGSSHVCTLKRVRTASTRMILSSFPQSDFPKNKPNPIAQKPKYPQRRRPSFRRTNASNRHLFRAFDIAMRGRRGNEIVATLQAIISASKLNAIDVESEIIPNVAHETHVDYGDMHAAVERCMELGHWKNGVEVIHMMNENMPLVRRSTLARAVEGLVRSSRAVEAADILSKAWGWADLLESVDDKALAVPDEKLCAMVANAAVERKQTDLASSVIAEMVENGLPAGPFSYSVLIKGYGREGKVRAVESLLVEMKENKVALDTVIFNGVVDAYIRADMFEEALATVESMKSMKAKPNTRTYNTLLKGLAASGRISECLSFREKMIGMGILPNGVTRNTLVDACVRAGRFEDARILLHEISGDLSKDPGSVFAYTSMVHGLALKGRLDEAFEYVNELERGGIPANLVTYTALISAYIHVDEVAKAWFLFRGMKRVSLAPDASTYMAMISGLCQRRETRSVEAAHGLVDEMIQSNIPVLDETYNSLMDGYVRLNMMKQAENVFTFLESPSVVSYTTLLQGYGKAQDMVKAKNIFRTMREKGIKPDRVALNTFLSACIRCRDMGLALRVFREMDKAGGSVKPNVVTYGALILGYAKEYRPDDAWDFYQSMKEETIQPNELLLNRMLQVCIRGLLPIECGVEIIRDMVEAGCSKEFVLEKKAELRPLLAVASEVWKQVDGVAAEPSELDRIFERHGWNVVDSSFRPL